MTDANKEAARERHHTAIARLHEVLDKVDEVSADLRKEVEDAYSEWYESGKAIVDAR